MGLSSQLRAFALAVAALLAATAADAQVALRIVAINDLHGRLEAGDGTIGVRDPRNPARSVPLRSGGAAHLATLVHSLRAQAGNSVFVSAGDLIGATPLVSALFRDEPTVEVMNALGLDLNAVGNHEFDQGVAELRRIVGGGCATIPRGAVQTCAGPGGRYGGARFPFLAANVVDAEGKPLFAPSWVKNVDGVRVGFIGTVTRSTPGIVMPAGIRGWHFEREVTAINRSAQALKREGINAIVAVVHEGGETDGDFNECREPRGEIFEIARQLDPAIAVVLSGHTHRAYNCRIDGRIIIQGASYGRLVSVVDLSIDRDSGEIGRGSLRSVNLPVPNGFDEDLEPAVRAKYPPLVPDESVAALVRHYHERAAPLADAPVGRIGGVFTRGADPGGDHAAGRLIADAQLAATRAHGAQLAFTNPGGVRTDLAPRPPDGRVTYGDAFSMQPFGNALVTLTLNGAQVKALLESQWSRRHPERVRFLQPSAGFEYAWRGGRPYGHRVDAASLRLNGRVLRPDDTVRITVNSFLAAGGDGFSILREGTDLVGGPLDVDALTDYLRQQSATRPLAPDRQPRIERLD